LAFNQLSFDSVVRLFVTFQQYVSRPALGEDERFYAPDARPLDISEYDADRFLDMQMELLAAHDTRAPPAPDLQYILKDIWARLPAISKVHYISYAVLCMFFQDE
jgi:hypothetical protein